jgi:hypothetical protein
MSHESPEPEDDRGHNNAVVLVAVIVLLAIAWFLIHEYSVNQAMENCRIEGRRDCAPIQMPPRQ